MRPRFPRQKALIMGRLIALFLGVMVLPARGASSEAGALEYKVKAGYLFNFAKFIEWPASSLPETATPFVIGVLEGGEALQVWKLLLTGKNVNGHPVEVKAVSAVRPESDLHILFVTRESGRTPEEVRAALGAANTLVVGESDHFAERGGMVGFVREDDVIRLTLNLERANAAGLKVSAKLSSVARVVKSRSTP